MGCTPTPALPHRGRGQSGGARAAPGLSAAQFLQGGLDVFFFFAAVEAFAGAVQFFVRQQFGELFLAGAVQFAVCLFEDGEDVVVQREVFVLVAVAVGFAVLAEAGEDVMREAFVCGQGGKACGFGLLRCLFGGDGGGLGCGFGGVFCRLFGFGGLRGVQFVAQGGGVFEVGAVLLAPVAQGGVVVCWVDFDQRPAEGEEVVLVAGVFGGEPDGFGVFFVGGFGALGAHYFDFRVFFEGFGFRAAVFAEADEEGFAGVKLGDELAQQLFGAALPCRRNEAAFEEQLVFFFVAGQVVVVGGADEAGEVGAGFTGQVFFRVFEALLVVKQQVVQGERAAEGAVLAVLDGFAAAGNAFAGYGAAVFADDVLFFCGWWRSRCGWRCRRWR